MNEARISDEYQSLERKFEGAKLIRPRCKTYIHAYCGALMHAARLLLSDVEPAVWAAQNVQADISGIDSQVFRS